VIDKSFLLLQPASEGSGASKGARLKRGIKKKREAEKIKFILFGS